MTFSFLSFQHKYVGFHGVLIFFFPGSFLIFCAFPPETYFGCKKIALKKRGD